MVRPKTILQWPDTFVEHLTGAPGEANEELFHYLIATLPPRLRDAVMLHFHDCFPYRIVGEKMGTKDGHTGEKISVSRAMQLASRFDYGKAAAEGRSGGSRTGNAPCRQHQYIGSHPSNATNAGESKHNICGTVGWDDGRGSACPWLRQHRKHTFPARNPGNKIEKGQLGGVTEYENDYQSLGQGYAYLLSDSQTASMPVLLAGYSDCRAKHHVRPHCTIHLLLQLRKMDACGWTSEKLKPESWVIMPLYTCPRCHYTFPSVEKPGACPDCGHKRIVPATDFEFNRFYAEKLDLIRTVKADDMSVDERNWSRILLLLNVPKASFYTSFFIKQHILEGDAEHALRVQAAVSVDQPDVIGAFRRDPDEFQNVGGGHQFDFVDVLVVADHCDTLLWEKWTARTGAVSCRLP